jgi:hypothetical protein
MRKFEVRRFYRLLRRDRTRRARVCGRHADDARRARKCRRGPPEETIVNWLRKDWLKASRSAIQFGSALRTDVLSVPRANLSKGVAKRRPKFYNLGGLPKEGTSILLA